MKLYHVNIISIFMFNLDRYFRIDVLNELRDTVPKSCSPEQTGPPRTTSTELYEMTWLTPQSDTSNPIPDPSQAAADNQGKETPESDVLAEPIYSQPVRPSTKKINREACEKILVGAK